MALLTAEMLLLKFASGKPSGAAKGSGLAASKSSSARLHVTVQKESQEADAKLAAARKSKERKTTIKCRT
jgi:hypothetical protein